jgi:O-antigen/teichoic acid export membrane protein
VVICSVMLLYFLHRLFPLNRPWSAARRDVKEMFRFSAPLYGSRLISFFGSNLQTLLLGALNAVASVGIFSAAARLSTVGTMFRYAISAAAEPVVSELYSKGEHRQLGRFYQNITKWTLALNLPLFLIILFFSKPILSVFGSDFIAGSTGLSILFCGSLIDAGTGIGGVLITMTGKTWLNPVNTALSLTLSIVLSLLFIPSLGIVGAAIAMTGTGSVLNIVRAIEVFILFRLLPYNKDFIKPIVAGVVAAIATYAMVQWVFVESNLVSTAFGIGCLLIGYATMILLLGLSEEDRMILIRLRRRLLRGFS